MSNLTIVKIRHPEKYKFLRQNYGILVKSMEDTAIINFDSNMGGMAINIAHEDYGVVSPDGKFYECEYFAHISLADKLLEEVYKQQSNNPVDKLCKLGWVVIQSSFIGFAGDDAYHTPQLTREQKQWLEENESRMSYDQHIGLKLCLEINEMLYEM